MGNVLERFVVDNLVLYHLILVLKDSMSQGHFSTLNGIDQIVEGEESRKDEECSICPCTMPVFVDGEEREQPRDAVFVPVSQHQCLSPQLSVDARLEREHQEPADQTRDRESHAETLDLLPLVEFSSEDLAALSFFVDENSTEAADREALDVTSTEQEHDRQHSIVQTKQPIRWDPNKARNQRKAELIYLRKQVSELEMQLRAIKLKKTTTVEPLVAAQLRSHLDHSAPATKRTLGNPVASSVWEEVARRQGDQRIKSERENVRLKLMLEKQFKIAKNLEKFLTKTTSRKVVFRSSCFVREKQRDGDSPSMCVCVACTILQDLVEPFVPWRNLDRVDPAKSHNWSDAEIFEDLAVGIQESYAEIDAIFEANGLARMETSYTEAQIHQDTSKGMSLHIFANQILPFEMETTATAVWQHFLCAKERLPYRSYHFESPKVRCIYRLAWTSVSLENPPCSRCVRGCVCRKCIRQKTRLSRASTWCFTPRAQVQLSASINSFDATANEIAS